MELVCPAGNLACLKAAVDAGANAVYLGFRDATNARNFEGLNFSERRRTSACFRLTASRQTAGMQPLRQPSEGTAQDLA